MNARTPVFAWASENLFEIGVALAAAAAIVAALYALRIVLLRAAKKLGEQSGFTEVFADAVRRTRVWFLVALALQLVQGFVHPPQDVAKTITFFFTIATALQAALWARALIVGLIEHRAARSGADHSSLTSAMGLIRLLVSIAVFAIAGVVVLDNLGVNVTGLVAGLGIGGIAIGLAAQGIFSDLFAALSILFDKPFRVGDTITYQGKEGPVTGTVEQIGLKSTRIRSLSGELRIIGNTQLLAQEVTNFAGRGLFRFSLPIGVVYHTDPAVLREIPAMLQAEVMAAGHRFVTAFLKAFGPSSIDFEFLFEVDSGDGTVANAALQDIALRVLKLFNERGIEFAFPTQTTMTAGPDGKLIMPYPETWDSAERA